MTWEISPHVCRVCFGRVLIGPGPVARCADCGLQAEGAPNAICACGAKLPTGRNAGFACRKNGNPTPENPFQIVVLYLGSAPNA